ncbi:endo-exonuclease [Armillaria novae-zelandiae]|uniref:Endo-exonuclease n=1 Tax=Armillaria novae-zelandiae TaxID=153914 RepID=A0AA39NSG3_9AGAR|nr:endo-exonuclease [Armillaria novae-zelandiae]
MFKGLFIITCLLFLGIHALPTDLSNVTDASNTTAVGMTASAAFTFMLDYLLYPQSCKNICFSWYCMCALLLHIFGPPTPHFDRCSISKGHLPGYQCDKWPRESSTAGGANAAMRCIPAADNTGSGSSWGNFINIGFPLWQCEPCNNIPCLRIQNRGPQALGTVADGVIVQLVDIKIINVLPTAYFCLGEIGLPIPGCTTDAGQPMLQQIG